MVVPFAIGLCTFVGVGALLAAVRRLLPDRPSRPHQDTATAIFTMVGVLQAVVLAFVVIVVWEADRQARAESQVEANAVARIYFTARSLPEPQRHRLMGLARDYATTVAGEEWPLMTRGETSAVARRQVADLRVTTQQLRPASPDQEILMAGTLDAINELVDARRERTTALTSPLSPLMWTGLFMTSALAVGFMCLFNRPGYLLHLLMVGPVAVMIAFVLWLIHDLSHPFSGANAVPPDAFVQILQRFEEFPPYPTRGG
jgi:uncharacterized protein DUF4239